jgi:hypothetical protein
MPHDKNKPLAAAPPPTSTEDGRALCSLCGMPMPKGEEMFQYHGYSGPCPQPKREFYDQGWNDRVAGKPFVSGTTKSWRDGWKDCDEVPEDQRTRMDDPPLLPARPTEQDKP